MPESKFMRCARFLRWIIARQASRDPAHLSLAIPSAVEFFAFIEADITERVSIRESPLNAR